MMNLKSIDKIMEECELCNRYRKPKLRPVRGFCLAGDLSVVSMDLQVVNGVLICNKI